MDEQEYEIVITPFGNQSEVRKDGELVPRLHRIELTAAMGEPTRLILYQYGSATIKGVPGERTVRHDCPDCQGHAG